MTPPSVAAPRKCTQQFKLLSILGGGSERGQSRNRNTHADPYPAPRDIKCLRLWASKPPPSSAEFGTRATTPPSALPAKLCPPRLDRTPFSGTTRFLPASRSALTARLNPTRRIVSVAVTYKKAHDIVVDDRQTLSPSLPSPPPTPPPFPQSNHTA